MYKAFPSIRTDLSPEYVKNFTRIIKKTDTIAKLRSAGKWGRLFGGAACIIVIKGHDDLMQPLELDDIEVGAYQGLIPLDRWSGVIPGPILNSNIEDAANFGLPVYYNCIMDAGNVNIHHSRILRFCGRELPQWEKQVELYWGMSEVEIVFDELQKRDYSSWNIVSLLTRAQLLSITEPQLAGLMSGLTGSNGAYQNFVQRMTHISETVNNQGLLVLGKDGQLHQTSYGFGGVGDVYHEFMKDLAAACEIPYEIIFGRESGLGSNAEGSLQIYDNLINEKRISEGDPVMERLIPIIAMSTWGFVPDDLNYNWMPFRALSQEQRTNLARGTSDAIITAYNSDLLTKREARQELKDSSGVHGLFDNITVEAIAATPDTFASEAGMEAMMPGEEEKENEETAEEKNSQPSAEGNADQIARPVHDHAVDSEPKKAESILDWISNRINLYRASK
jgi:phage-related protein (TIGR01555 family)